jgi:hypothetical protein
MPNIQYTVGGIIGAVAGFLLAWYFVANGTIEALETCNSTGAGLLSATFDPQTLQYCGYAPTTVLVAGGAQVMVGSLLGVLGEWLWQESRTSAA